MLTLYEFMFVISTRKTRTIYTDGKISYFEVVYPYPPKRQKWAYPDGQAHARLVVRAQRINQAVSECPEIHIDGMFNTLLLF